MRSSRLPVSAFPQRVGPAGLLRGAILMPGLLGTGVPGVCTLTQINDCTNLTDSSSGYEAIRNSVGASASNSSQTTRFIQAATRQVCWDGFSASTTTKVGFFQVNRGEVAQGCSYRRSRPTSGLLHGSRTLGWPLWLESLGGPHANRPRLVRDRPPRVCFPSKPKRKTPRLTTPPSLWQITYNQPL